MFFYFLLFISLKLIFGASGDVPCSPRLADYGYVCVCNATYCDTVSRPTPLEAGNFYQYSTSETTPGFTKTTGKFTKNGLAEQTFKNISDEVHVQVNGSVQYQELNGIGTALSDNSGYLINFLSEAAKDNFVESIFGENGLEMSYVRVPISGSDFSMRHYTYDDVPGDYELKHWSLSEEDYNIKLPLLRKFSNAYKREGGVKIYGVTWTAPSWMKTNNESRQGFVKNEYLSTWANYHIKFLQAYKNEGVDVWGISLGNEMVLPLLFGTFFGMPNTVWMPNQARLFVKKYLIPALKENGFENTKIYSLDDERPFITWWSDRLFKDKEVRDKLEGIAVHWYLDGNSSISKLEDHHKTYPDKQIMYTESSINSFQSASGLAVELGSWDSGVRYIDNMYQNLCHWVSVYMDWNVALDPSGGPPSTDQITLDASVIINATLDEFYKQPIYYVLGHFSKFILPGAYRVQALIKQEASDPWSEECYSETSSVSGYKDKLRRLNDDNDPTTTTQSPFPTRKPDPPSDAVLVLAASNPDGSHSIVTYNPRSTVVKFTVDDVEKGQFEATLQPNSMNTFIYW